MLMTMNRDKPKYQVGDRVGIWKVTNCSYSNWLNSWVYNLELGQGRRKLTASESTLDAIAIAFIEQN